MSAIGCNLSRSRFLIQSQYVATKNDVEFNLSAIVAMSNELGGPLVGICPRRGYGLFANRAYAKGELITEYGGVIYSGEVGGDYAARINADSHIDGHHGFKLREKGRWINEFSGDPEERAEKANATLGLAIRASRYIENGQQIFVDYGGDYVRDYQ
jgi:hypothetical protein